MRTIIVQSNLIMQHSILLGLLLAIAVFVSLDSKSIKKRQLFREQVVPNMGGKVPDSAFHSERLALNQLNARGIYSSTGTHLEHRESKEYHQTGGFNAHHKVRTMQVQIPQENRFVAPEGRYDYRSPVTLDTTYVIREPAAHPIGVSRSHHFDQHALPLVPYHSLKLAQHYMAQHRWNPHQNDVEGLDDFSQNAKKLYLPYLKKLHEVDE